MAEPLQKEAPAAGPPAKLAPIDMVRAELARRRKSLEAVLPKHLTPERLCRLALIACEKTPKLLEADRASLFGAILTAAQLGLEPDGILGQGYLVPYKGKVQFIPGYRGLIALARQTGEVQSVSAGAVHAKDKFEFQFGLNEKLDHIPSMEQDRGEVTHFWMVARFMNGGHHYEVMTRSEVEAIRNRSASYQSGGQTPWKTDFEEMGKKTVIKRGAKYLPMNVQKAAALIDAHEAGRHAYIEKGDVIDVESRVVEAEKKATGDSFFDRFEGEPVIDIKADVVAEEKSEREPGEDAPETKAEPQRVDWMATEADYRDIKLRAEKRKMAPAALEALCMQACGRALGEITHDDANKIITELSRKG